MTDNRELKNVTNNRELRKMTDNREFRNVTNSRELRKITHNLQGVTNPFLFLWSRTHVTLLLFACNLTL